jgi:hypothetical protein
VGTVQRLFEKTTYDRAPISCILPQTACLSDFANTRSEDPRGNGYLDEFSPYERWMTLGCAAEEADWKQWKWFMTLVQKIDTMLVGPAGLPRETLRASGSLYRPKPLSSGATMSYSPEAFCFGGRYAETIDQTSNSSPARLADVARRRKGADCSSLPRHDADRGRAGDDFG